jgi:hypothetical protein
MRLALFMLSISFLAFLFEKVLKKRDGESEYKKFPFWVRFFLLAFQVILFGLGCYLIFDNDSNSKIEKAQLKHEKDSLRTKSQSDSVALHNKWVFDSSRLKEIIGTTEKITSMVNNNLNRAQRSLKMSESLLKNINNIDTGIAQALSLEQSKVYPDTPMDYTISYSYVIKRKELEKKFPMIENYFSKELIRLDYARQTIPGLRDTTINIDAASINNFDSATKAFLVTCNISILFKSDPNAHTEGLEAAQNEVLYLDSRNGSTMPDIISDVSIKQNKELAVIKITSKFVNTEVNNLEATHINGIRDVKGWFFSLILDKQDADSVSVSQLLFYTGKNKYLNLGYNFHKGNEPKKFQILNKKIATRDFILHEYDLYDRDKKLGPEP